MALGGPERPEGMRPMDHVVQAGFRLDAHYREAMRTGEMPAEDGDPVTAVIREHISAREEARGGKGYVPMTYGESLLPPMPSDVSRADPPVESTDEIKRRKEEYDKLKETPGMEQVLRARDYLNALTFARGNPSQPTRSFRNFWSGAGQAGILFRRKCQSGKPRSAWCKGEVIRRNGRPGAMSPTSSEAAGLPPSARSRSLLRHCSTMGVPPAKSKA
jgi:hypothetical protein